jgi:predicted short-subunit dehydrogenase-like oxidoreductase (DUF2520 family)
MPPTLNIIGCGRLGRTLARLWSDAGVFKIGDINDHTLDKSHAAVAFIGSGRACGHTADMRAADLWLLAPPDDRIALCCEELVASAPLAAGNIVFHCSGALSSTVLSTAAARGATVASVHPLKTFADASAAVLTFNGSRCAAEGDAAALSVLQPAFERIGAQVFAINAPAKTLYHAASVMMCNYLTALLETGARSFEAAGLPRDEAMRMVEPLVRETLDNVFAMGPARALTGPIVRGDVEVVRRQVEALTVLDPHVAEVYRSLGVIATQLAAAQGAAKPAALAAIEALLQRPRA